MSTLYGEGSDHGQARVPAVVGKSDADRQDERAARFRSEVADTTEERGALVVAQLEREFARGRSARTQSEADRQAGGMSRLSLRISTRSKARLEEICAESGYSFAEQVEAMIDGDYEEWRRLVPAKRERR